MLGFTPYQLGQLVGAIVLLVVGIALVLRFGKPLLTKSVKPATASAPSLPQPMPDWSSPEPAADENAFFGGSIAASPTITPYSGRTLITSSKSSSTSGGLSIILLVVGLILAVGGAFTVYHTWTTRGLIHLPDQLLGLDRAAPDSPLGQAFKTAEDNFSSNEMAHLQYGIYGDTSEFIMVTAGVVNQATAGGDMFGGVDQDLASAGLSGVELRQVDAGPAGGEVRCAIMSAQHMSVCLWASAHAAEGHGIAGLVYFNGAITDDYTMAMRQIRFAVGGKNG